MQPILVETDISSEEQAGGFQNATLQDHAQSTFSVACHVQVPYCLKSPDEITVFLKNALAVAQKASPALNFHVQVGVNDDLQKQARP